PAMVQLLPLRSDAADGCADARGRQQRGGWRRGRPGRRSSSRARSVPTSRRPAAVAARSFEPETHRMSEATIDLILVIVSTVFAGSIALYAWRADNVRRRAFAQRAAEALGGTVEGDTCRVTIDGATYAVRRLTERRSRTSHRSIVVVTATTPCPAYFTLAEADLPTTMVLGAAGGGTLADLESAWRIPAHRMDSASPAWAKDWLANARVREQLRTLVDARATLLHLKPDGVECRRPIGDEEAADPAPALRPLLDAPHAVVTSAASHRPDLVAEAERTRDFNDNTTPLMLPMLVMFLSLPLMFASIWWTSKQPSLGWGAQVELVGCVVALVGGLWLYKPVLRRQVANLDHPGDIFLGGMMLMGTALLFTGIAVSRPLVLLLG
ncbi:MAG: hypothetical protein KDC48_19960, partial [Planctomycetes bacterium]|nr:hypothetical protein [Planctomycetota bacterium]